MLALLRTRRWLSFTALAIAAIIAFGFLSNWQFHRAAEENHKADAVAVGAAAPPVALSTLVAPGEPLGPDEVWRSVTVRGTFDCDSGFLVRNRPMDARNGFWVVCPLRTDAGAWLSVNRGWMPASGAATAVTDLPAGPTGPVSITGRLRASEGGPDRPPADLPAGQVTHLNTDVLAAASGIAGPRYEPYLEATAMDPADPAGLATLPLPSSDSAQNFSYAGQWLLFAAIAIGGWFYFLRREAADDASARGGPDQPEDEEQPQPAL